MARMKSLGATMSRREVFQLANESKAALLHRIHDGGKDMPSFSYLNEAEVQSLMAYLNVLAGVPGSRQIAVPETQARIGELIAKSTCHICHSATGRNPTLEQLAAGAIPPLSTLTARVTREELVHKVADGAPVAMGGDGLTFRGRMPVFFYLSKADAADVYEYLRAYPPSELAGSAAGAALTERPPGAEAAQAPSALSHAADRGSPAEKRAGFTPGDWLWSLSITVLTVLGATFFVTVREVQRLSAEAHARKRALVSPMPVAVYLAFRSWGGDTSDDPGNANDRAYSEHTEAHLP
jgi:mono/diheme cytochrome c family protein